jgi:hypothetical protein
VFDVIATPIAYTFIGVDEERRHSWTEERRLSLESVPIVMRTRQNLVRGDDEEKGLRMAAGLG